MTRLIENKYIPSGLLIVISILILCGMIFSRPAITGRENGDFSHQNFITLSKGIAPVATTHLDKEKSLLNADKIIYAQQLSYNLNKDNSILSVNISKKQLKSALIFKSNIVSQPDMIQVLRIVTGKFTGIPLHQICPVQATWFPENNQNNLQSIPFQMISNSMTYVFVGRIDSSINGNIIFSLELPNINNNDIVYEFKDISTFAISSKYINEFYPPDVNYDGIRPYESLLR